MTEIEKFEYRDKFKYKTKMFALRIARLYESLPKTSEAEIIGKQLLRSATSIATNYRALCRLRSDTIYYSKISVIIEAANETMSLLELLQKTGMVKQELLQNLYAENEEILNIVVTARKNFLSK